MRSLLIGEGARQKDLKSIEASIRSTPGVERLIHLKTQHLGPEELLVAAKIHFDESYSISELAEAINRVEKAVRAEVPIARPMYIEPDIWRD